MFISVTYCSCFLISPLDETLKFYNQFLSPPPAKLITKSFPAIMESKFYIVAKEKYPIATTIIYTPLTKQNF
jgi:hypothetical protein